MRGKGTGRIRSSRQNRKRRVRIRRNGHESLSSLRIQNPVLGGRIASAESSRVDRILQELGGALWSWGDGGDGRLGHGDEEHQLLPKKVKAFAGRRCLGWAVP